METLGGSSLTLWLMCDARACSIVFILHVVECEFAFFDLPTLCSGFLTKPRVEYLCKINCADWLSPVEGTINMWIVEIYFICICVDVSDSNNDCLWNKGQDTRLRVCWQSAEHAKQWDNANGRCRPCKLWGEAWWMASSSLQLLARCSTEAALTVSSDQSFVFSSWLCCVLVPLTVLFFIFII